MAGSLGMMAGASNGARRALARAARACGRSAPVLLLLTLAGAGPLVAQEFSGDGPASTRPLALPAGVVAFDVQHQGSGHYRFQLVDEGGKLVENILDGSGEVNGSGELRVPRPGQYRIDVTGSGPWAFHLHAPAGEANLVAASAPPGMGVAGTGSVEATDTAAVPRAEQGRRDGVAAGRAAVPWSWGWFGTGLAAGLVTGPVGTAVATIAAGRGTVRLPGDTAQRDGRGADYARGWTAGFVDGAITSRRESALVGGLAGTLVFGWAILRMTHLGSQGGTSGTSGSPPPNMLVLGVRF